MGVFYTPGLIREKDKSRPLESEIIWTIAMIPADAFLLLVVCFVHEPTDNQCRNARPYTIGYVADTDDDVVQAIFVLE
jgi:hypothetical protein